MLRSKKFEDAELQALLDENSAQILEELTKALNVGKLTVSDCLHTIRKIRKESKWIPLELSKLAIQNCLILHFIALHCSSQKEVVSVSDNWQ